MSLDWLDRSNPVAIRWCFLVVISIVNITLWLQLRSRFGRAAVEPLLLLCAVPAVRRSCCAPFMCSAAPSARYCRAPTSNESAGSTRW
jgi:hypothetical protein